MKSFPTLQTERLVLRELRMTDAGAIFANLSDAKTMEYFGMDPLTRLEQVEPIIEKNLQTYAEDRGIRWAITFREEDRLIGTIGYHHIDRAWFRSEIAYELNRSLWGKGVMREALLAVLPYGFDQMNLNRIEGLVSPENVGSLRLLEKSGFTKEGVLKEYMYFGGRFHDAVVYALLKSEFEA
ncbi:GNAT family N-acetyltransferase [Tumebacillus lipolyticus]|uniref:GNAT family N-acetyltransferase n=1 Tax=Tumebacillus lipolyticus TaxID=1280370 RepID=A0ABW5A2C0_9BACL